MENSLTKKIKKIFLLALAARILSTLYYGAKIVGVYRGMGPLDFEYGVRNLTMAMTEYAVTEMICLAVILVGMKFLFKNLHQEWADLAVVISFFLLLPSWAAPAAAYGLYVMYKESKQVQSWIADFKV